MEYKNKKGIVEFNVYKNETDVFRSVENALI